MTTTKQIKETLRNLGIRPNLNGFEYLTDAIRAVEEDPNIKMTALYTAVAKRHDTTPASVERCMRHAIHKGVETGDQQLYAALFGHTYDPGDYITVSLFIHTLVDYFKEDRV